MKFLKLREILRGSDCWNCKRKQDCPSYQATKNDGLTVLNCKEKK